MTLTISLEPPQLVTDDNPDQSLFARPARLVDLDLASGDKLVSRDDPDQDVGQRLRRLWAERGDFSALTADKIKQGDTNDDEDSKEQTDDRPSAQDMRQLSQNLLEQLNLARGELHTALDLLSVLSEPTDPPSVEPDALPLPQQSLILTHTATPPPPPTDPAENPLASLPLAISLNSIQKSANAFFAASEALMPNMDDDDDVDDQPASPSATTSTARRKPAAVVSPWPTLLHLHSKTAHTLLPLGAKRGATLSGKGEANVAREVGVFFGCEEAGVAFRRLAVARVKDLQEGGEEGRAKFVGRKLCLRVEVDGEESVSVWDGMEGAPSEGVDRGLRERGAAMFVEELFASLSAETRSDSTLKASLVLGKRSTGDSITLAGHNYKLTITAIHNPPPSTAPTSNPSLASLLLPLTRLLFLQEYATRRQAHAASQPTSPHAGTAWSRPILASLGVVLAYVERTRRVRGVLDEVAEGIQKDGTAVEVEFFGGRVDEAVARVLETEKELGGRAVLRVGSAPERLFHVSYSLPLPHPPARMFSSISATVVPSPAVAAAAIPTLVLQAPGRGPFVVPSVEHLRLFLVEQVRG